MKSTITNFISYKNSAFLASLLPCMRRKIAYYCNSELFFTFSFLKALRSYLQCCVLIAVSYCSQFSKGKNTNPIKSCENAMKRDSVNETSIMHNLKSVSVCLHLIDIRKRNGCQPFSYQCFRKQALCNFGIYTRIYTHIFTRTSR